MIRRIALALAVGAVLGAGSAVRAGTTTVDTSGSFDGANKTLDYVLGQAYGYTGKGTGSVSTALGWTSLGGSITFMRINDSGGAAGNLALSGSNLTTNDAVWQDGTPTFAVDVKMAANFETFGWYNNVAGANQGAHDILTVNASTFGLNPTYVIAAGGLPTSLSSSFTWYDTTGPYGAPSGTNTWYSDPALNPTLANHSGEDHMVTYWVTGTDASGNAINGGAGAFVICFEDLPFATPSDFDYQDLVVQVAEVPGSGTPPVPLPAAVWAGMGLMGAMAGVRFVRRRRQA